MITVIIILSMAILILAGFVVYLAYLSFKYTSEEVHKAANGLPADPTVKDAWERKLDELRVITKDEEPWM